MITGESVIIPLSEYKYNTYLKGSLVLSFSFRLVFISVSGPLGDRIPKDTVNTQFH